MALDSCRSTPVLTHAEKSARPTPPPQILAEPNPLWRQFLRVLLRALAVWTA
jgi:hypothetical protein